MSRSQQELIAQVRAIMQSLSVPVPQVLALIEDAAHLGVTQLHLPLVEFSPFAELAVPQLAPQDQVSELRPRMAAPTMSFAQVPKTKDTATTANDAEDQPVHVFSLRTRAAAQTTEATVGRERAAANTSAESDLHRVEPHHKEWETSESIARTPGLNAPVPDFSMVEKPLMPERAEVSSSQTRNDTISWIEFATHYLAAIDSRSSLRPTVLPEPGEDHTVTGNEEVRSVREANTDARRQPLAGADFAATSVLRSRDEGANEMPLTTAFASGTAPMAESLGSRRHVGTGTLNDAHGNVRTPQSFSLAVPFTSAALDADEIAALVNDILVEQARRYGVDLS